MKDYDNLQMGGLENWLLEKGVKKELIEHELFKLDGLFKNLIEKANLISDSTNLDSYKNPIIEMQENSLTITFGKYTPLEQTITLNVKSPNEIQVLSSTTKQKDDKSDDEYRRLTVNEITIGKENAVKVSTNTTFMDKNLFRIFRELHESVYDQNGIERYHQIFEKEDESFFLGKTGSEITKERDEAEYTQNYAYQHFMDQYSRTDIGGINIESFQNPDYLEKVNREQFDVANVQIFQNRKRLNSEYSNFQYDGYVPLDSRHLESLRLLYGPRGSFKGTEYFTAPEIPQMSEEEIIEEIQKTGASDTQKQALLNLAKDGKRTEFSYTYLNDPKYQNGRSI